MWLEHRCFRAFTLSLPPREDVNHTVAKKKALCSLVKIIKWHSPSKVQHLSEKGTGEESQDSV